MCSDFPAVTPASLTLGPFGLLEHYKYTVFLLAQTADRMFSHIMEMHFRHHEQKRKIRE